MNVSSLGYIALSVQSLDAWQSYATEVLGLQMVDRGTDNQRYFKMDDQPFRLMVEAGEQDKLLTTGWELANQADYQRAIKCLQQAGCEVQMATAEQIEQRCVTALASSTDPAGNRFEIYYGRTAISDDFKSPLGVEQGGVDQFVTGDMGMGHIVIPAPNIEATHDFYTQVLGFGDSDDLHLPPPAEGAPEQRIIFMHAANPRHHSLALYNYPIPSGIVHMIFEVTSIDEVGACMDRAERHNIALMANLGRHCNDNMLSFYMFAPGGIGVEYGCEGKRINWQNFTPTVSTQGDFWGHAYQLAKLVDE